jgi:hypothetical protein
MPIPDIDLHNTVVEQPVSFSDTVAIDYGNNTFFAKVTTLYRRGIGTFPYMMA